jgi:hypothetical protein
MISKGNSFGSSAASIRQGGERPGNSWLFWVPGIQKLGNALLSAQRAPPAPGRPGTREGAGPSPRPCPLRPGPGPGSSVPRQRQG